MRRASCVVRHATYIAWQVGTFVHVYVDSTGRPMPIDETVRSILTTLT